MTDSFIVFEGPEGAGKSTQISRVAQYLTEIGREHVVTREPGGTPVGNAIREVLLGRDDYVMLAETEAFLLSAARVQHVHDVIRPALARGSVVICDRFADSSMAYQGGGGGMDRDDLRCLQRIATGGLKPNLRVLLDLPVEIGLGRRHQNENTVNRIDRADLAFHRRVRSTFLELAADDPVGWSIIDASRSIEQVSDDVIRAVRGHLST